MVDSMSEAVRELLNRYPMNYEFGLWDLKRDVVKLYPPARVMHGDTISRRLREFRHGKNFDINCINPNKSRYKKVEWKPKKKGRKYGKRKRNNAGHHCGNSRGVKTVKL